MRITIEIDSKSEMEKLSTLLKTFNINAVKIVPVEGSALSVKKGDKKIDPKGLLGYGKVSRNLSKKSARLPGKGNSAPDIWFCVTQTSLSMRLTVGMTPLAEWKK